MFICPACGQEAPESFRFCPACGRSLSTSSIPQVEERKVVTVVFCDLAGFTARSEIADPEDVLATLRPYHTKLKREIERNGGRVEKFIGDAVVGLFGAPLAHEDDAQRGVAAALSIIQAVDELNREHSGLDLAVRVAVNTGEGVVTLGAQPELGEGMVAGDVINTAARLQSAAPVGGVIVGEITYRATREAFTYRALGPVSVKGKVEPIRVWQPLARISPPSEMEVTPFIGRAREMKALEGALARCLSDARPLLCAVIGEPGIGKSRLAREFHRLVGGQSGEALWRQGRCLPYGEGITFWALGEVVKAHAGIFESDDPDTASRRLRIAVDTVIPQVDDRNWVVARLGGLVGMTASGTSPGPPRAELFAAWRRFLHAIAASRPLVLVFEDLHWADAAMLEFVEYLTEPSAGVPLLVIGTARNELLERRPEWGKRGVAFTRIVVPALSEDQTSELIESLLERQSIPDAVHVQLLERCGGNPLFAEQFVRMVEDRRMVQEPGLGDPTGLADRVPETVQALIASRLDALAPERKALLQSASVVGKVFWSATVAVITGESEPVVQERLDALGGRGLIRREPSSSMEGQAEYSFWHALIRDVAYAQIPRARRAERHRATARWMEAMAGERVADLAELLAYHYQQALSLFTASGQGAEAGPLKADLRRCLLLAGERAMTLDVRGAESFFRRALELYPSSDPERPRVLLWIARAAEESGRLKEAEQTYEKAAAEALDRKNGLLAGDAVLGISNVAWFRGDTVRSDDLLTRALKLLEGSQTPELATAYGVLAGRLMTSGRNKDGLELAQRALTLARKMDLIDLEVRAHTIRGLCRVSLSDVGGVGELREALRLGHQRGLGRTTRIAYNNLAAALWMTEGPASALECYSEGTRFAERRGMAEAMTWWRAATLGPLFDVGHWDEVLAAADEMIQRFVAQGGHYQLVEARDHKALVLASRGEVAAAALLMEDFLPGGRAISDPQILVTVLTVAALVEQERGNQDTALDLVREVAELCAERPGWYLPRNLPYLLRICERAAGFSLAERLLRGVENGSGRGRCGFLSGQALLHEAQGNLSEAASSYAEAAAGWLKYGHLLARGHALLGWGRTLRGLGREPESGTKLQEAEQVFRALGASPWLEEAHSYRAESGATPIG